MAKKEIFERMRHAVLNYDRDAAERAARQALEAGIDPVEAIESGFSKAIKELGDRFERMEIFLPHLLVGAEAMEAGVGVLESEIIRRGVGSVKRGTVVIGTVEGDIHDIGKTLVSTMLRAAGFRVYDLGKDVPIPKFVETAEDVKADIIAASALLNTTMRSQRDIVEYLATTGLRNKYSVMVGGAPVSSEWAKEIGADGYAKDAVEAVEVAQNLLKGRKQG